MAKRKLPIDHAKEAARHHTTLSTFAAVVALLEGGMVYDHRAQPLAQRIIDLCQAEQQRQLRRMDAALEKVKRG